MAVPVFWDLMLPILKVATDEEMSISDVRKQLVIDLNLSDEDLAELLPSGRQTTFVNRVSWARIYLEKAGLIKTTARAHFRITAAGKNFLATNPGPITKETLEAFPDYVAWKTKNTYSRNGGASTTDNKQPDSDITPEERMEASYLALNESLESELMNRLLDLSPAAFEQVIVELLLAMGYGGGRAEMGKAIGRSGDEGIDGIIKEDELGLDLVYMQAKRYAPGNSVGRPAVQGFSGSLDGFGATRGIFVTTSTFTVDAAQFVERISKRIILIDGQELARLMIKHGVGVREKNTFKVMRLDEDFFSE